MTTCAPSCFTSEPAPDGFELIPLSFEAGPLGITLKRNGVGKVLVAGVLDQSQATAMDVRVKDELWAVGERLLGGRGVQKEEWESLVGILKTAARPLVLTMLRAAPEEARDTPPPSGQKEESVVPPVAPSLHQQEEHGEGQGQPAEKEGEDEEDEEEEEEEEEGASPSLLLVLSEEERAMLASMEEMNQLDERLQQYETSGGGDSEQSSPAPNAAAAAGAAEDEEDEEDEEDGQSTEEEDGEGGGEGDGAIAAYLQEVGEVLLTDIATAGGPRPTSFTQRAQREATAALAAEKEREGWVVAAAAVPPPYVPPTADEALVSLLQRFSLRRAGTRLCAVRCHCLLPTDTFKVPSPVRQDVNSS